MEDMSGYLYGKKNLFLQKKKMQTPQTTILTVKGQNLKEKKLRESPNDYKKQPLGILCKNKKKFKNFQTIINGQFFFLNNNNFFDVPGHARLRAVPTARVLEPSMLGRLPSPLATSSHCCHCNGSRSSTSDYCCRCHSSLSNGDSSPMRKRRIECFLSKI